MNKIGLKFVLLLSAVLFMGANVCKASAPDTLNIPIVIPDNGPDDMPHRAPIHSTVYGVVSGSGFVSFMVSPDILVAHVRFYRNGLLVATDDNPVLIDDTLFYNLSSIGSGAYTVLLEADDGTVYVGTFIL